MIKGETDATVGRVSTALPSLPNEHLETLPWSVRWINPENCPGRSRAIEMLSWYLDESLYNLKVCAPIMMIDAYSWKKYQNLSMHWSVLTALREW